MLSKEALLVMSYSRSKAAGGERDHAGGLGRKGRYHEGAAGRGLGTGGTYPGHLGSKHG